MELSLYAKRFPRIDPDRFKEVMTANGYMAPVIFNDGYQWAAVARFIFTWGILYGDNRSWDVGPERRWCYHTASEAVHALADWMERGWQDKPTGYITEKGA